MVGSTTQKQGKKISGLPLHVLHNQLNKTPAPSDRSGSGGGSAKAEMASPQPSVGDQNRWSLSNNAPFFLCISIIPPRGKGEVGEGLEKVSEGRDGCRNLSGCG